MQTVQFLNTREKKEIYKTLEEQFGSTEKLDYAFFQNSQDKIFFMSNDYAKLNTNGLRINNRGMYFATKERDGIRLSIEGAQLIKPTKNVIHLDKKQVELWMKGEDIPMEGSNGYVIIQHEKDILGCGMLKNNTLRNMVPKERRLHSITESSEE
ncbi:hypothetical protein HZA98_04390 [Candidatus Woesearchaeota archaeon]|nr:hypothetical protein [Candidatus Woesearchaeota archaeon]